MATNEMRHLREIAYPNADVSAWDCRFKERCSLAVIWHICRIVIDPYDVRGLTTPVPSLENNRNNVRPVCPVKTGLFLNAAAANGSLQLKHVRDNYDV